MSFRIRCPHCRAVVNAPLAAAGKVAACPGCKTSLLIPAVAVAEVEPLAVEPPPVKRKRKPVSMTKLAVAFSLGCVFVLLLFVVRPMVFGPWRYIEGMYWSNDNLAAHLERKGCKVNRSRMSIDRPEEEQWEIILPSGERGAYAIMRTDSRGKDAFLGTKHFAWGHFMFFRLHLGEEYLWDLL
jgi:hypothetical protein